MKVTFLMTHMLSGGAERTVAYLSSYMVKRGMDITVLTLSNFSFYSLDPAVKFVTLGIPTEAYSCTGRLSNIWKRISGINNYINRERPDAFVCFHFTNAIYLLPQKKKFEFRLITSEINNPAMSSARDLILKKLVFRRSDAVIFQTSRAMEYYPKDIQRRGLVIPNAIGNELIDRIPRTQGRNAKVTAIGRLADQKDYPTLFSAMKIVIRKHPEYVLEVFGTGPEENRLRKMAVEMCPEHIFFRGVCIDALLQASDSACYVLSSKYEGMPNTLMEAMAIGLPCVSTDCPYGPSELIQNGYNGILVPVGDASALAEGILKMIENRPFAESCGERAREIRKEHSVEVIAKRYMDSIIGNDDASGFVGLE